jgi:hypothetical protein
MTLREIILYFVVDFHNPNVGTRDIRLTEATTIIGYTMEECGIVDKVTTKINPDMVKECLLNYGGGNHNNDFNYRLKGHQVDKVINLITLINRGCAPTGFATGDWVTAYEQLFKVGGEAGDSGSANSGGREQQLSKPAATLQNFIWTSKDPLATAIHFLSSMKAWGIAQYEGADRYLDIAREPNTNKIKDVFIRPATLDNKFDRALHAIVSSLLHTNPMLQERVLNNQVSGRELYRDVIDTLVNPLEFTQKQYDLNQKLRVTHRKDYESAEAFIAARNNTIRILAMLGDEVTMKDAFTSMIAGIQGIPNLLQPLMLFKNLPPTRENYELLQTKVLDWSKEGDNTPPPTVAVRNIAAELDELKINMATSPPAGGGAWGGSPRRKNRGGRGGSPGRGNGGTGGRGRGPERQEWTSVQKAAYAKKVEILREEINGLSTTESPPMPGSKGNQQAPDTNAYRAAIPCPPNHNAGSAVTSFHPNPFDDSGFLGVDVVQLLGLASSEYSDDC